MNGNNNLPVIRDDSINIELSDVTQQILDEKDPKRAKELLDSFNWAISRK